MREALIGSRLFAWQAQDARVQEFPQRAGPQIEGAKPGGRPLAITAAGGERDAKASACAYRPAEGHPVFRRTVNGDRVRAGR